MALRIEGALRFPSWSPTPRDVSVWVVKPLRGEWQVLQATELSAETRFSSKIMSPSFALASVIGLSGGVNDLIVSAAKRGTGGGCCAGTETAAARKTSTGIAGQFIFVSNNCNYHRTRGLPERITRNTCSPVCVQA
jgi:hypothetical protein